jgi:hypothetical protein
MIMHSTTFSTDIVDSDPIASATPRKPGLFASIYSGIIAGQEAKARAVVARHMALYDDAQLLALGWSEAEIAALRRGKR